MGFESLLGNDRLKQNLTSSLSKGHVSHFYLLSGPEGSGKHTLARLMAAAILCQGPDRPCLHCTACRKIMDGQHPDFITVDEPEKKTVSVDLIRNARADMYIQPNESDHKIYLFPRAQDIGLPGQNALLKVLEEPPAYGVFLLLTDNPEKLTLQALPESILRRELRSEFPGSSADSVSAAIVRSGGYLGQAAQLLREGDTQSSQAEDFAGSFSRRDALGLMRVLVPMERWKREPLLEVLSGWLELLESALVSRSGLSAVSPLARQLSAGRSSAELMEAVGHLQKAILYVQSNVSPAAVCGYLEWALR